MKTVTAYDPQTDSNIRISLPQPIWTGRHAIRVGVWMEAIYVSPRSKRCVVETDSAWEQRDGSRGGTSYTIVDDEDQLASLAGEYPEVADALEKCDLITVHEL
jgi:hypothetical protein